MWNNGLRKVINAIPGHDDIGPLKFARGGAVLGGVAGKDSVLSLLMPGEHVLTAKEVQALGGQSAVYALRQAIQRGETDRWDLPAFATGGALDPNAIFKAKQFAQGQVGKPYVWGGVGPNGYDCSGFMSALTNVLRGHYAFSRVAPRRRSRGPGSPLASGSSPSGQPRTTAGRASATWRARWPG